MNAISKLFPAANASSHGLTPMQYALNVDHMTAVTVPATDKSVAGHNLCVSEANATTEEQTCTSQQDGAPRPDPGYNQQTLVEDFAPLPPGGLERMLEQDFAQGHATGVQEMLERDLAQIDFSFMTELQSS